MRYIVNSEQMRRADENTSTFFGVDSMILMERASLSMAEAIMERFTKKDRILIFAGSGGNGGDGVCLGRILFLRGFCVTVCLAKEVETCAQSLQKQVEIAKKYQVPFVTFQELQNFHQNYAVIVDGLLGNGVNREVTGVYADMIRWINEADAYVYAVDLPSGLSADNGRVLGTAVRADETISFGFEKVGTCMYPGKNYAGRVTVAEIGITRESFLGKIPATYALEKSDLKSLIHRPVTGNKGTFGKVAIVAGSYGMAGAAMFSARASLRMGAGMVKIITHCSNREIIQSRFPEAMLGLFGNMGEQDGVGRDAAGQKETCDNGAHARRGLQLEEAKNLLYDAFCWADAAVIGPGLSTNEDAACVMEAFCSLLKEAEESENKERQVFRCKSFIIDADAINLISKDDEKRKLLFHIKKSHIIFTPHLMELSRLTGISLPSLKEDMYSLMLDFCKDKNAIFVCKDATTLIVDRDSTFVNLSGCNALATAGSGDCLTGILAALLAQSQNINCDFMKNIKNSTDTREFENVLIAAGCFLHGLLGEALEKKGCGISATASDLLEEISWILQETGLYFS